MFAAQSSLSALASGRRPRVRAVPAGIPPLPSQSMSPAFRASGLGRAWGATTTPVTGVIDGVYAGTGAVSGAWWAVRSMAPLLHAGPPATTWGMNPVKGEFTEALMHRTLMRGFFEGTHWASASPARVGKQGIDGLFFRTDRHGNLRDMMVAEAKYGTSRLRMTKAGRQMSSGWTRPWLAETAQDYRSLAKALSSEGAIRSLRPPPQNANTTDLPSASGKSIQIWREGGRLRYHSPDPTTTPGDVLHQARRVALYTQAAAEGKIAYRSRLFSAKVTGNRLTVTVQELDPATGKAAAAWREIPITQGMNASIEKSLEETFIKMGLERTDAKALARRIVRDPQLLEQMNPKARWSARAGLQWENFAASGLAALAALVISSVAQWWQGAKITWGRNAGVGAITGTGALMGGWVGTQVTFLLRFTTVGQRVMALLPTRAIGVFRFASGLGSAAGGLVAVTATSYLLAVFGLIDWRDAHRSAISGAIGTLAGAGFYAGTFSAVAFWGTASTGTAISTLSGAAATNATLAAIGGSVAAGSIALTAGAAVVMVGVALAVQGIFSQMDAVERKRMVNGRLRLIEAHLEAGRQLEWSTGGA
jgi:hypothetical protein